MKHSLLLPMLFPAHLLAGSFSQNFDSLVDNAPLSTTINTHVNLVGANDAQGRVIASKKETNGAGTYITSVVKPGIGTVPSKALRLAEKATLSTVAAYHLPQLDPTVAISEITLSLDLLMGPPASGLPADGFNISFGKGLTGVGNSAGHPAAFGFSVNFDTFSNSGTDPRSIEIFCDGVSIANFLATSLPGGNFTFDQVWRRVELHWDANGLDLTYGGTVIAANLPLVDFNPQAGSAFAFNSATGGSTQDTFIDNVSVTTVAPAPIITTGVVIQELLADNASGLEDEDTDQSDWFELYNGTAASVTLTDWYVSNDPLLLTKWKVPALTIPAGGHQVFFASAKAKFTNVRPHTNFTLEKTGGQLLLVRPDGTTIADSLSYGPQKEDVSYGRLAAAQTVGHLTTLTPGSRNAGPQAANPPLDVPIFSQVSSVLLTATPVPLTLSLPLNAPVGAEIRYTLNNAEVTSLSPLYTAPLSITTGTTVRAKVMAPNNLPSKQGNRSFIVLANGAASNNLADNYNASTQPFTSNLPVLVLDSYGRNVDALTDPQVVRPYRFTQVAVYDLDPMTARSSLGSLPNLVTRGGTHVRGQSSSGQTARPYALEFWKDNEDTDDDHALLGFPKNSDWVLMTLTLDKSLMRNYLMQQMMLEANGPGAGMRCRFVEVFFNQGDAVVDYTDYRGVYLLMEKPSRDKERVNIAKLNDSMSDPALINGGYIIKNDKTPYEASFTPTAHANVPGSSRIYDTYDPEPVTTLQVNAIRTYMTNLAGALGAADWNQPASANYYGKWLDERSFIDKTLWYEVCKEVDAYIFSYYFSKDRNGVLKAFPFWDVDRSLGNSNYGSSNAAYGSKWWYVGTNYTYYSRLAQDAEYTDRYWNRWAALRRGLFSQVALNARIEAAHSLLTDGQSASITNSAAPVVQNPAARHYRKYSFLGGQTFGGGQTGQAGRTTYRHEVDAMKLWLFDRLAWLDTQSPQPAPEVLRATDNVPQYGGNVPLGYQYKLQSSALGGDILYTVNGPDPRNTGGTVNPAAQTLTDDGGQTDSTLMASGQTWKWLLPAAAPAANWFSETFDDASWTGPATAPLGYGEPVSALELATNISPTAPNYTLATTEPGVAYFRRSFTLTDPSSLTGARLEMQADDGAVVYLNGLEIARMNFPYAPVVANFTQEANGPLDPTAAPRTDTERIYYPIAIDHTKLRAGVNTIAVEVHQAVYSFPGAAVFPGLSLSDLRFDARIVGSVKAATSTILTLASPGVHTIKARVKNGAVWGPLTESIFVVEGTLASAANLVVSELHYHPAPPSIAEKALGFNKENDFEFIELMNISNQSVDLSSVVLAGAVDYNFSTATPSTRFLPPGGRVVVVENSAAFQHRLQAGASPIVAGTFLGNFANDQETVIVRTAAGALIKSFNYYDFEPWPVAADGTGYSLVLTSPLANPDHNLAASWQPSAVINGNPGAADFASYVGSPAAWEADTDGDGLSNGVEYALGRDSQGRTLLPTAEMLPFQGDGDPEPTDYIYLHLVRDLAAGSLTVAPELSSNLVAWDPNAFVYDSTVHNGDGTATLTYRSISPRSALPTRLFFHVRASQVVP